jgi:hypothetical protein
MPRWLATRAVRAFSPATFAFTLMMASAAAAAPTLPLDPDSLKPNQVRVLYVAPKDSKHQHIHDRLRQRRVIERLAEYLAPFRLPREVTMKVEGCDGTVNAFYEEAVIKVCYEYIAYIYDNAPTAPLLGGLGPEDALIGPTVDVFLHEFGHAVFDLLELPVMGREEDAADLFSAYTQLMIGKDEARVLIVGTAFLGHREMQEMMKRSLDIKDFAKEHGLPAQRFFNILCIAYGFDKELFADAVSHWHLPSERAEGCEDEYHQLDHAFHTLILPYVDASLLAQVRARKWLRFEQEP